eukprot:949277-Rhodomonas_salina.2
MWPTYRAHTSWFADAKGMPWQGGKVERARNTGGWAEPLESDSDLRGDTDLGLEEEDEDGDEEGGAALPVRVTKTWREKAQEGGGGGGGAARKRQRGLSAAVDDADGVVDDEEEDGDGSGGSGRAGLGSVARRQALLRAAKRYTVRGETRGTVFKVREMTIGGPNGPRAGQQAHSSSSDERESSEQAAEQGAVPLSGRRAAGGARARPGEVSVGGMGSSNSEEGSESQRISF